MRSPRPYFALDGNLAQFPDLFSGFKTYQAVERRLDDIMRIGGFKAFGKNIADSRKFKHGACGAAGDDAGSGRRRLENDPGGAKVADHLMREWCY